MNHVAGYLWQNLKHKTDFSLPSSILQSLIISLYVQKP